MLYEVLTKSDRCGSPTDHSIKFYCNQDMLRCCPGIVGWLRAWTMHIISGIVVQGWWYIYEYDIRLFHENYKRYGPRMIWVDLPIDHCMTSNYNSDMLNCYPGFQNPELDHIPHQWCCGSRMMTKVLWICYHTIWWVLYETWTMSDSGGLPHRPLYDFQLHLRHTQLLP